MYECLIITLGRIGDSRLVTTLYETAVKKNGILTSLVDAVLHAYRVCNAHQKVISYTYQLFTDNYAITSTQYEEILRTLTPHAEYDSLCQHIINKMKEHNRQISIPILSILLNTLDVRSPSLTISLIRQTRFGEHHQSFLNILLSREMTKFSEKSHPQGMFDIYREMSDQHLPLNISELSRLKRIMNELLESDANYPFNIRVDDHLFTELFTACWMQQYGRTSEGVGIFAERVRRSQRNKTIEFFEGLKYVRDDDDDSQ